MYHQTKKEIFFVQIMLVTSLLIGFLPPLIMFLFSRKKNEYYYETSRKALNFHLTIFPFFFIGYFLSSWYVFVIYIVLGVELFFILNAMIRIALHKGYQYPAIAYINSREKRVFHAK